MTHLTPPQGLPADLRRLTTLELSLSARLGYVGLLLASTAMTTIVAALLATEPALPRRTSIALAVLAAMGASWIAFAVWVLTGKRILLGRQRIVAGRLAVAFSTVFVLGALAIARATSSAAALTAAAIGMAMLVVAATMLIRAGRAVARLSARRHELERELGRTERRR